MIYILGSSLWFSTLAAAVWIAGYVLEGWIPPGQLPADLRQLARFCLGLLFWIAAAFVLAVSGALQTVAIAVLGGVVALAALVRRWRRVPVIEAPRSASLLERLPALGLALVLVPVYLLTLGPEVSWDASTYHLTLPRLYAEQHGFRPVELSVYSNWPMNTELLFTLAMVLRDHMLAKLVHFGFGLLTLYAIHVACRGADRYWTAAIASAFFLANHVVLFEMAAGYADLAHAFFFIAAFVFIVRAGEAGATATGCLVLGGLCAGLMAGVKVSGITGAAILVPLLLPWLRRAGVAYVLPVVLLAAPWLIKAWWYTGNPVYPLAYSVFGGPDWSAGLSEQLGTWLRGIGMGRELLDYLLLPVRIFLYGGDSYERFSGSIGAFWLIVLPLAFLCLRTHALVRRSLLVAGLFFVFWSATSQQMRLFLPALPLLAIASATGLSAAIERLSRGTGRTALRVALLAGALALVPWNGLSEFRAGLAGRREAAIPPVFEYIDRELPPAARLLFVNTNHGFHCKREFIADSFFEASQTAEWLAPAATVADVRRLLAERRITHLLVFDRNWGIDYPPAFYRFLLDPAEVQRRFESPGRQYTLLEVLN